MMMDSESPPNLSRPDCIPSRHQIRKEKPPSWRFFLWCEPSSSRNSFKLHRQMRKPNDRHAKAQHPQGKRNFSLNNFGNGDTFCVAIWYRSALAGTQPGTLGRSSALIRTHKGSTKTKTCFTISIRAEVAPTDFCSCAFSRAFYGLSIFNSLFRKRSCKASVFRTLGCGCSPFFAIIRW